MLKKVKLAIKKFVRVVGYMGEVDNMNRGKSEERNDRRFMLR